MPRLASGVLLALTVVLLSACAEEPSAAGSDADDATEPAGGGANLPGASGGNGSGGASSGGSGGGGEVSSGAGGIAGGGAPSSEGLFEGLDCRPESATCLLAPEPCPDLEVREVVGGCFGDCVPVGDCGCSSHDDCPDPQGIDEFACLSSKKRCSPWL